LTSGIDILGILTSFATFLGVYAILALSLNLEYGYAGQPNFGKVLFYSVGCYLAGFISTVFLIYLGGQTVPGIGSYQATVLRGISGASQPFLNAAGFIVALIVGFVFAALVGYVASFPALKLREDYLGMTLLVAGEIVRIIVRGQTWFSGGAQGIAGVPNPFIWIGDAKLRYLSYAVLVLGFALLTCFCMIKLTNSPYGRLLKSVRDDDLAAASFGKNVPRIRGGVLAIGSGFAGVAGVLYTYYSGFVQADAFIPAVTFAVWVMVIVGGTANMKGAFAGAVIISSIDTLTRIFGIEFQGSLPFLIDPTYLRYIAYAILIILVLMYRPSGLIPEQPVKTPAWRVATEEKRS
jgi:branched-chain amino acid transport system permease protein